MKSMEPVTLEKIRQRLIESIRLSHMSQKEIAEKLHISQQTVSCYMHGKKMPALDTLANLCAILDVDADYILCLKD